MSGHLEQGETLAEALAVAERTALDVLRQLGPHCTQQKILTGSTKRGPAFVYTCRHCAEITLISVPVGGLRDRTHGDPTSRTRISTFARSSVLLESGAYIESDGTVRARFVLHVPGHAEPDWDVTADTADAVGEAVSVLRGLSGVAPEAAGT